MRDELGLDEQRLARRFRAARTSALSFTAGAALSLVVVAALQQPLRIGGTVAATLIALGWLGDLGARLGGLRALRSGSSCGAPSPWDHRGHRRARRHGRLTEGGHQAAEPKARAYRPQWSAPQRDGRSPAPPGCGVATRQEPHDHDLTPPVHLEQPLSACELSMLDGYWRGGERGRSTCSPSACCGSR